MRIKPLRLQKSEYSIDVAFVSQKRTNAKKKKQQETRTCRIFRTKAIEESRHLTKAIEKDFFNIVHMLVDWFK